MVKVSLKNTMIKYQKKSFKFLLILFSSFQVHGNVSLVTQQNLLRIDSLNVLFIGNSLTFTNNLPELVKKEALKENTKLETTMIAYPNYALVDHWNDGKIQKLISKNKYDFVVVQQGPSSQAEGRKMLLVDGSKIKKLCDDNGARLVYFMVWPSKQYYYTFNNVIKNHINAATKNNALLAPVGAIWKAHFDQTGDFSYYGNDGFHPSLEGSKIAAQVITAALLNKQAIDGSKD